MRDASSIPIFMAFGKIFAEREQELRCTSPNYTVFDSLG
jgi:hypothetical protein